MAAPKATRHPPEILRSLQDENDALSSVSIYSICHRLGQIEVLPAGVREPREAIRLAGNERPAAIVTLRMGDRFAWLDEREVVRLIECLSLARDIAQRAYEREPTG